MCRMKDDQAVPALQHTPEPAEPGQLLCAVLTPKCSVAFTTRLLGNVFIMCLYILLPFQCIQKQILAAFDVFFNKISRD